MSRTTRPVMQVDSQARALPTSGDWTTFRGAYVGTNLIYGGFAKPGSAETVAVWQIFRCTHDAANNITAIQWPISPTTGAVSNDFEFIWTNRAALTYV